MAGDHRDDDIDPHDDDDIRDTHAGGRGLDDLLEGSAATGYVVGYGRPPLDTRFRPGQSGNPAGRPKGPRGLGRDLFEELQAPVPAEELGALESDAGESDTGAADKSGKGESPEGANKRAARRTLTRQRAILRGLVAKAQAGDARATALLLTLIQRLSWADPEFHGCMHGDEAPDNSLLGRE